MNFPFSPEAPRDTFNAPSSSSSFSGAMTWKWHAPAFQDHSFPLLLMSSIVLLYTIYTLIFWRVSAHHDAQFAQKHGCKGAPLYPHLDPLLGLDSLFLSLKALQNGNLMSEIDQKFKTVGESVHTFSLNFLGSKVLYTKEPENVKTIFAINFTHWGVPGTRKDALAIFGPGIFSSDGAHWESSRALLRPSFVRSQIGDMLSLEKHVAGLLAKIPRDGEVVEMHALFSDFTMDSATELWLGESTGMLQGNPRAEAKRFSEAFIDVSERLSVRMGIGKLATLIPDLKFHRGIRDMKSFVDLYVSKAIEIRRRMEQDAEEKSDGVDFRADDGRYVFISELAKSPYSKERIAAELMAVIVAGRSSIASLLTVFWYTVARRPDIFQRLREEITQKLGRKQPTFEELKGLKYLGWTMREIQRLYPVIPVNSRVALRNTVLPLGGGPDGSSPIFVRKGTRVLHFPFSMHRRKDIYGPDVDEFKPERWKQLRTSWEYLPFSGGPRNCIGQQMAITAASYASVRMLQMFKGVEAGDATVWKEKLVLAMSVRSGCKVRFTLDDSDCK